MKILLAIVLCIALGSLACASSQKNELTIEIMAENTRFAPDTIEIPAGKAVTLTLKNRDSTEHDLEVRGLVPSSMSGGGHEDHMDMAATKRVAVHTAAKKSASVQFRADQKGTYEVFCSIPGHEQSGMVAKLVVI